jgi:hypothetical protein
MYYPIISQAMCFVCCLFNAGFCLGLFLSPGDGSDMFLWNVGWLLTGPHSVISQMITLFYYLLYLKVQIIGNITTMFVDVINFNVVELAVLKKW